MDEHARRHIPSATPRVGAPHSQWDEFCAARTRVLAALARDSEVFRLERAYAAPARTPHQRYERNP